MSAVAPSRVVVDLDAYAHNLKYVRGRIPYDCQIMAVVKANAYGHGLIPIARRAVSEKVSMLGVATVDEAVALRNAGITAPILVLMQPTADAFPHIVEHGLRVMLSDMESAARLGEIAHRVNKVVPVHCKVDSGMGRQGFDLDHAPAELMRLTRISNIDIEGIGTHFPVADIKDDVFTLEQIKAFKKLLKNLEKGGVPFEVAHAANSPAIVNYIDEAAFGMVRPGLMTYGVWPTPNPPDTVPLKQVLRWETRIVILKDIEAGTSVGYGRTYTTQSRMRAAVLPVGYADGYKHALSNKAEVLVGGKRCPVRGSISMDQMLVDVTEVDGVMVGDVATLIGRDGNETITAEELARHAQGIPYDILAGIGPRVEREYAQ